MAWAAPAGCSSRRLAGRFAGYGFPWGTLTVNVLGCAVVGALGALFAPSGPLHLRHDLRMVLIVGILGGFTTFSAFSLEALQLVQRGAPGAAAGYVTASVVLCLLAASLRPTRSSVACCARQRQGFPGSR